MIQTPVIVTFANQKGGVGKTTLCVTFANYLVTKGARVVVIDCDFQHSIMKCRKADIRKYGEQEMPYEVWAYEANDKAMMTSLMEKLHNDPEIDIVLMDTPSSLKAEGLIPCFSSASSSSSHLSQSACSAFCLAFFLRMRSTMRRTISAATTAMMTYFHGKVLAGSGSIMPGSSMPGSAGS